MADTQIDPKYNISDSVLKYLNAVAGSKRRYYVMTDDVYDKKFLFIKGRISKSHAIINYLSWLFKNGPVFDSIQDARKYIFKYSIADYKKGGWGGGRIFTNKPRASKHDNEWDRWEVESVYFDGHSTYEAHNTVMADMQTYPLRLRYINANGVIVEHAKFR